MGYQSEVLLKIRIHEHKELGLVFWAVFQDLLEQVSNPLNLATSDLLNNLGQVCHPDFIAMRPIEDLYGFLIDTEALLLIPMLLEEPSKVEYNLWCGDPHLQSCLVCLFGFFEAAKVL